MTHPTLDAMARIQLLQQHLIDVALQELGPAEAARVERALAAQVMLSSGEIEPDVDEQVAAWLVQILVALRRQAAQQSQIDRMGEK